jgi:hypothetical protein
MKFISLALLATFSTSAWSQTCPSSPTSDFTPVAILTDGGGFLWDINNRGDMVNGPIDEFDDNYVLAVDGTEFTPDTSLVLSGREATTGTDSIAGLDVHRRIFVPETGAGFARTLNVFTNPTGSDITVDVFIYGNLGSDNSTFIVDTSSGDTLFTPTDFWAVSNDLEGIGSDNALAHVIGDGTGLAADFTNIATSTGCLFGSANDAQEQSWTLTVPAGTTRSIMMLVSQRVAGADAVASAEFLSTFPLEVQEGLTPQEIDEIVNFGGPPVTPPGGDVSIDEIVAAMNAAYVGSDPVDEASGKSLLRPSTLEATLQRVLDSVQAGGCTVSTTEQGWAAGSYTGTSGAGEDQDGALGSMVIDGGTKSMTIEMSDGAIAGDVFSSYNKHRQILADIDGFDPEFFAGPWLRVKGARGGWAAVHGTCDDTELASDALEFWYRGSLVSW